MMFGYGKTRCIFLIIAVLICVSIISILNTTNENKEDASLGLSRDYVLSDSEEGQSSRNVDNITTPVKRNKVRVYRGNHNILFNKSTNIATLKTWTGKKTIYVHPSEKDYTSARLREYGTWEEDFLNAVGSFILRHPNTFFVDIGCNIGVYTLFVANLGVSVLAVDPVEENLQLLSMTLRSGGLENNVSMVLNAISDKYQTVRVQTPRDNVGGAHVIDAKLNNGAKYTIMQRETILLDDLLPYMNSEDIFIKMDIEGYEWNAVHGAKLTFKTKNVRGILMEWVHHKYTDNGRFIINYLLKEGLLPCEDVNMTKILDFEAYHLWPENVFWIKR